MSISFPPSPTAGQIYQNWVWNASAGTWDAVNPGLTLQLRKQIFYNSGTYAPSPGMFAADVEVLAGGGAGAGSGANVGGGGGAGGYSKRTLTAAQIGASQVVTIGAGGTPGAANAAGNPGGASSFGSLVTANGGAGGVLYATTTPATGGAAGVGDLAIPGQYGQWGSSAAGVDTGMGGSTPYGAGGISAWTGIGNPGRGYGAGGGGSSGGSPGTGGAGAPGICIVTEYCWMTQAAVAAQAASGARVLLSSQTVTTPVASVDFTSAGWLDNQNYDEFELVIINAYGSAPGIPSLRVSQNYGSTWDAGASSYMSIVSYFSSASTAQSGGYAAQITLASASYVGATYGAAFFSKVRFARPWSNAYAQPFLIEALQLTSAPAYYSVFASAYYQSNVGPGAGAAFNALRFYLQTGNITAGTFKLYGIVK